MLIFIFYKVCKNKRLRCLVNQLQTKNVFKTILFLFQQYFSSNTKVLNLGSLKDIFFAISNKRVKFLKLPFNYRECVNLLNIKVYYLSKNKQAVLTEEFVFFFSIKIINKFLYVCQRIKGITFLCIKTRCLSNWSLF